jgi:hypothetical protein
MKRNTTVRFINGTLGALIALGAGIAPAGFAQGKVNVWDFAVTMTTDSTSPGTLRKAIADANAKGGGTIHFAPGLAGTILLTGGELRITANVKITGPGANILTISGNNASRVFMIETPAGVAADVAISGLTIRNGFAGGNAFYPGKGGGIYVHGANLTLSQVSLADNIALGGDAAGGGLYGTSSIVTVAGSTVSGNQAVGGDSVSVNGAAEGGGVALVGGSLTLDNNGFEGNQAIGASAAGGAIAFTGGADDTLAVDGSSISGNQSQGGGGNAVGGALFVSGKLAPTKAVIRRTRLAGNIAGRRSPGGNSGASSAGGGLFVDNLASVTLVQDAIFGNLLNGPWDLAVNDVGTAVGGGAYVNAGGFLAMIDTPVTLNAALPSSLAGTGAAANSAGGGVFVASGGAIVLEGSTTVEQNFARNYPNVFPPSGSAKNP